MCNNAEVNYTFKSTSELMMAILHSGNLSNMDKLVRGRNWGQMDVETGLTDYSKWQAFMQRSMREGVITQEHMNMAQEIWDLIDSFKAGTQAAHKKIYGHFFDEITANPIQTPWGTFKGGYIPAVVDPYLDDQAAARKARNELEDQSYATAFPSTGRGATMKRVQAYAAPLSLEMRILSSHIDWALRFTHLQPVIKDISKIVTNRSFREYMSKIDKSFINDALIPWLQRVAAQKVTDRSKYVWLDKVAGFLRRSASLQIMGFNFSNGLQQLTGVFPAMSQVGPKHFMNAVTRFLFNPIESNKNMANLSPFMKSIIDGNVVEIEQSIKEIIVDKTMWNAPERFQIWLKKHGSIFAKLFQGMTNTISWNAALNQKLEAGISMKEAVRYADSVVRTTQGTGLPESISSFEVGTPGEMLFKQFISYFNMLANLQYYEAKRIIRDVNTPSKYQQLFYLYAFAHMLPAMAAKAIAIGIGNGFNYEDDDEFEGQLADVFLWSQLETSIAMLPFGQIAQAARNAFNEKPYDDRISLSPGIQILETVVNVPGMIWKKKFDDEVDFTEKDLKNIATGIGFVSGMPSVPIWSRYRYIEKSMDGEIQNQDTLEFTRGVLVGKTRKE